MLGTLPGQLFIVAGQVDFASKPRVAGDFVCTLIVDADGHMISHTIDRIGERGAYPRSKVKEAADRHLAALGPHTIDAIWIRPFTVKANDLDFGFVPRQLDDGSWRVEFMPGNTLSFYSPWDEGGYDT